MPPCYLCMSGKQARSYRAESVWDKIYLRVKMHFVAGNLGWSLLTFIVRTYAKSHRAMQQAEYTLDQDKNVDGTKKSESHCGVAFTWPPYFSGWSQSAVGLCHCLCSFR